MDSFNYVIGVITPDYFSTKHFIGYCTEDICEEFSVQFIQTRKNYMDPFLKWKCIYRYNVTCYMYFVLSEKSDNYRIN